MAVQKCKKTRTWTEVIDITENEPHSASATLPSCVALGLGSSMAVHSWVLAAISLTGGAVRP